MCEQKYHNIKIFCGVCDSPTLKRTTQYHNYKILKFSRKCQSSRTLFKQKQWPSSSVELDDILSNHDSKWKIFRKINDIHSLHTRSSDNQQEFIFKSIREIEPDIFKLITIFMDSHDELLKEIGDMRKDVNIWQINCQRTTQSK